MSLTHCFFFLFSLLRLLCGSWFLSCFIVWLCCAILSCNYLINRRRWLLYFGCALAVVNLFVCVPVSMNQQN